MGRYLDLVREYETDVAVNVILPPSQPTMSPAQRLYPWLEKKVMTPKGPGTLWQAFSTRAGVVLDSDPEKVTFFFPAEIQVGEGV